MMRIISGYFWWAVPLCVSISVLTVLVVARGGSLWASHRRCSVLSSQACIITQRKTFPQLSSAKLHHWAPARQERVSASSRSLHEALSLVLISCVLYRKEIVLFWSRAKVLFFSSVGLWLPRWCSCFTHFDFGPSQSAIITEPPCCDLNTEPACLHSPDPLICLYSYLYSIFLIFNFLPKFCFFQDCSFYFL